MRKKVALIVLAALMLFSVAGCVDQHAGREESKNADIPKEDMRIIATSVAIMEIMEKMDVNLVGIPHSDLTSTPERYAGATEIGMPMQPDIEIVQSLDPDWVFSPNSLEADLKPKYEAADVKGTFLDLRSVDGMFTSIEYLGGLLGKEQEAQVLIDEYNVFYKEYKKKIEGRSQPKVLVLMGLPGSYVVATEHSYVGSLVKMAGGINVYEGEAEEFISANTEDMLQRDPDIILRTAHALPEQVMKMFADEFEQNDIWKHFRAVQEGSVHDLPSNEFGMSAKFNYPDALNMLQELIYQENSANEE